MESVILMPDGSSAPSTPMNLRRKLKMETDQISATKARRDPNIDSDDPGNIRNVRELDELRETLQLQFENELLQRDDDHLRDSLERERAHDEQTMKRNREHTAETTLMMKNLKAELDEQRALDREKIESTFLDLLHAQTERFNELERETERLREHGQRNGMTQRAPALSGILNSHLGVCHPAANILADFADCYDLEESLKIEKKGIVTLYDYFQFLIKEYKCLAQAFVSVLDGASITSSISRFQSTLRSLKKPNGITLGMLTLLAVDHFCPKFSHKISSTLAASASLTSIQRSEISVGESPVLDSSFSNTPFNALPGIAEILEGSADAETFVSFVLDRISFIDDVLSRLDDAKRSYFSLNGAIYTDCDLLFSEEDKRFGICTSWKGKPFIDESDRAEHFVSLVPDIVRRAWAEDPLDILSCDFSWFKFRSHLQILWKSAFEKQRLLNKYKVRQVISPNQPVPPPPPTNPNQLMLCPPPTNPDQLQPMTAPSNNDPMSDIKISCRECKSEFVFSVAQQEHHAKMGYNNRPARCQECKQAEDPSEKLLRLKQLPCYQFANGNCASGDLCKFSHQIQPPANKHVFHVSHDPVVEEEDDEDGFEVWRPKKDWDAYYARRDQDLANED